MHFIYVPHGVVTERTNSKEKKVMSEAIKKFVFADANEVRVVMQNGEPWFIAKDVCEILGTRTDNVRQIVGNKRVMSIDPYTIGDNSREHSAKW